MISRIRLCVPVVVALVATSAPALAADEALEKARESFDKGQALFEAGNYKYVREHATELAERSENAAVKRAATELLTRIEPDPLIRFLLGVSVVLLLFLTYYAYANHGH